MSNETDRSRVENAQLTCWSYTHARRHPSVLGKVGGANLPFGPYTPMQFVTFIVMFLFLMMTKGAWGSVIGSGVGRTGVLIFVPGGMMWFVRNVRVEGRSPFRFAFGVIQRLAAPRHGLCRGKRMSRPRPRPLHGHTYATQLDSDQSAPPRVDIRDLLAGRGSAA